MRDTDCWLSPMGPGVDFPLVMNYRAEEHSPFTLHTSRSTTNYFYFFNGHGDVTYFSDQNFTEEQIETYEYTPWGVLLTSANKNNLLYTSREFDFEVGLQFNRFRYYHPNLGRFVKRDFLDLSNSKYQFQYAFNNPSNLVDPLGLYGDWILFLGELCRICGGKSVSPKGNIFCYQRARCPDPATSCSDAPDTTLCCCL